MKPKAILFDLDGTLLNSAPDFVWVINSMLQRRNQKAITLETIKQQVSDGASAMISSAFDLSPECPEHNSLKLEFLQGYEKALNVESHLYKGIDELLCFLDDNDIPWGVITNKPSTYTIPILEHFKLSLRCATTICPEHVKRTKPDPEALILGAAELAIKPQHCWYIGDHIRDITAGNAAKMTTVACSYGYLKQTDDIQQWDADYIADSPIALLSLLETQLKNIGLNNV